MKDQKGNKKTLTMFSKGTGWMRKDNFFPLKEFLFKFKKEFIIIALLIFTVFLFLF